jgi:hypothetical protein
MKRRVQFFSTTGLLTTMEDTNAIEMTYPKLLDTIKGMFPDEVVWFYSIALEVRDAHYVEVATIYLF